MDPKKNNDAIKSFIKPLNNNSFNGITGFRRFLYHPHCIYPQNFLIADLLSKQYKYKVSVVQTDLTEQRKIKMCDVGTQYDVHDFDDWIVINDNND